ncbi:hypothetical protein GCM10025875_09640 [Litorihabitans aurantiacus]|uniref:2-isopropylmalate synthase n=1 Tax=Litorihabitans aurantiacus TaxID=1930061 RepID=A0AA37UVC7_9MICO|nr:hypothetical protein GCM10025875_09640 [Litorihabitans aurantiacus]
MPWTVPYLPVDPRDVGRTYEAVIRVNSQSGKGGIAYLMSTERHLDLPRRLQIEFSRMVQQHTDTSGGEVTAETLWTIFTDEYLPAPATSDLDSWGRFALRSTRLTSAGDGSDTELEVTLVDGGVEHHLTGLGNGPIDAFSAILRQRGVDVSVMDYAEHALSQGEDAAAAAYVEAEVDGQVLWGPGSTPRSRRRPSAPSSRRSTAPCADRSDGRAAPSRSRTSDRRPLIREEGPTVVGKDHPGPSPRPLVLPRREGDGGGVSAGVSGAAVRRWRRVQGRRVGAAAPRCRWGGGE